MAERIRHTLLTNSVSYTLLMLCFSVLSLLGIAGPLTATVALKLLAVTSAIALVMFFTDPLFQGGLARQRLVGVGEVVLIVFLLGGPVLQLFPLVPGVLLIVRGMICFVYFGAWGVLLVRNKADSDAINRQLSQRRRGDSHGR